jgi:4-amino-4-deoxy-L-arabinose transferase-like glycosyltransferase
MLLTGVALIAAFFSLHRGSNTLRVTFVPPWDRSAPGELYFWLASIMFLLPGCTLIGASLAGVLGPGISRLSARLRRADPSERLAMVLALSVLTFMVARIGNQVFLHGQPFTDDEAAARFGGQVLARGALWSPLPPMRHAFPELFLFQRQGAWTSFDFLGALLTWSLSDLTRSDTLVFSLVAAIPVPALAALVTRQYGLPRGLGAACLLLCSPMALTLSFTSHTHVVSRGLLALGLTIILFVEHASLLRSAGAGLALGLAWATRPPEISALLAPLLLGYAYDALRRTDERKRLLGLALGALPPVIATFAYNVAIGGSLGFLRGARNEISVPYASAMRGALELEFWPPRFGNNLSYNALTLSIWFLGPLGLVLSYAGASSSRTHKLLGLGVLLLLALCLLHDDRGLHMVGPIHLSESAVPLALLCVAGLASLFDLLEKLAVPRVVSQCGALGYTVLGLLTFGMWHTRALEQQAITTETLLNKVAEVERQPAIVLAAPFGELHNEQSPHGSTGGFVFEWPRARPDLAEAVLIVHDSKEARLEVERAFPQRTPYVFDPRHYGVFPVSLAEALQLDAEAAAAKPAP